MGEGDVSGVEKRNCSLGYGTVGGGGVEEGQLDSEGLTAHAGTGDNEWRESGTAHSSPLAGRVWLSVE